MRVFGSSAVLALACLLAVAAGGGAQDAVSADRLVVETGRHVYADGVETAEFRGQRCPSSSRYVVVESCTQDRATGRVDSALLGFDVIHDVEAGVVDLPELMVDERTGLPQTSTVEVTVHRPGALLVEVTGLPTAEVDPRPVEDTTAPQGQVDGRTARWEVEDAASGETYRFQVAFEINDSSGQREATYLPQVRVTLAADGSHPISRFDPATLGDAAGLDSVALLRQHVAPGSEGHAEGTASLPADTGGRRHWAGTARIDAAGPYDPAGQGDVTATGSIPLGLPASVAERVLIGATTVNGSTDRVEAVAETAGLDDGWPPTGWDAGIAARADTGDPLQDKDSLQVAVAGKATYNAAEADREPSETDGRLVSDTDGWSTAWASVRWHRDAYAETQAWEALLAVTAAQVIAADGDVDNRAADDPIPGEPIQYMPPEGYRTETVVSTSVTHEDMQLDVDIDFGDTGVTVTPLLLPGSYALEPTVQDGIYDWTAGLNLSVISGPSSSLELPQVQETVRVPAEGIQTVTVDHADGRTYTRTLDAPGTYRISLNSQGRINVEKRAAY